MKLLSLFDLNPIPDRLKIFTYKTNTSLKTMAGLRHVLLVILQAYRQTE